MRPLPKVAACADNGRCAEELACIVLAVAERDCHIDSVCTVLELSYDDLEARFYRFDRRCRPPVVAQSRACSPGSAGRTVHLLKRDQRFEVLVPL